MIQVGMVLFIDNKIVKKSTRFKMISSNFVTIILVLLCRKGNSAGEGSHEIKISNCMPLETAKDHSWEAYRTYWMEAFIVKGNEANFTGQWGIHKIIDNKTVEVEISERYSRHLQFLLGPYVLPMGLYEISLRNQELIGRIEDEKNNHGKCYLQIDGIPPVVVITGGNNRSAPSGQALMLDTSESITLGIKGRRRDSLLDVKWSCNSTTVTCPSSSKRVFTLTESMLADGVEVAVTATMIANYLGDRIDEEVSNTQIIYAGSEYSLLEISCEKNCPPAQPDTLTNTFTLLVVRCLYACDGINDDDVNWFVKRVDDGGNGSSSEIDYGKATNERKGRILLLKENSMEAGKYYAWAEVSGTRKGWAGLYLNYLPDPKVTSCSIEPASGVSLQTQFHLNCQPTDPDDMYSLVIGDLTGHVVFTTFGDNIANTSFFLVEGNRFMLTVTTPHRAYKRLFLNPSVSGRKNNNTDLDPDERLFEFYNGSAKSQSIMDLVKKGQEGEVVYRFQKILDRVVDVGTDDPFEAQFLINLKQALVDEMMENPGFTIASILRASATFNKIVKSSNSKMTGYKQFLPVFAKVTCTQFTIHFRKVMGRERFPVRLMTWTETMVKILLRCISEKPLAASFQGILNTSMSSDAPKTDESDSESQKQDESELARRKAVVFDRFDAAISGEHVLIRTVPKGYNLTCVLSPHLTLKISRNLGLNLKREVYESHEVVVRPTQDYRPEEFYSVTVMTVDLDLLNWNKRRMEAKTSMVRVRILNSEMEVISKVVDPVRISFKLKKDKMEEIQMNQDVFEIPENYTTFTNRDFNRGMKINRIFVTKLSTIWVHFYYIGYAFDVTIRGHMVPSYSSFKVNNMTVDKESDQYTLTYTNKQNYDVYLYVGLLPNMKSVLSSNETVYKINSTYTRAGCYVWKSTTETWEPTCISARQFNTTHVNCLCNEFSIIIGDSTNVPHDTIHLLRCEIALKLKINYIVFSWIVLIYVIYVCLVFLVLKEAKKDIYFLADNCRNELYAYLLVVKTHQSRGSGTTSNVMIKLIGENINSDPHVLNYPDPGMRLLQSNSEDWFILTTISHLGAIIGIDMWYDGLGTHSAWRCKDILVYDMQTKEEWTFRVRRRFALKELTRLQVKPLKDLNVKRMFCEKCTTCDIYHSWYLGHSSESFSYFKRITMNFSVLITTNALALIAYGLPAMEMYDVFETNTYFPFDGSLPLISFVSSIISFAVHITIVCLFRVSKIQFPKYEHGRLPFLVTVFCWVFLIILIVFSTSILLVYGWWVPHVTSLMWLVTSCLGMIANIVVYENIAILIRNFCFTPRLWVHHIDQKLSGILEIVEQQRAILYKKFGECLLRPYFKEVYRPLNVKQIRKRRKIEYSRKTVIRQIIDLIFVLGFLLLLHIVLAARSDGLMIYYHDQMRDIFEGGVTRTMPFTQVHGIEDFYIYLNETFMRSTQSAHWYSTFYLLDNNLMKDFTNSYLGVPRIRQIRLEQNTCTVADMMTFVNSSCQQEYTSADEETRDFESGWTAASHTIESNFYKEIWRYSSSDVTKSSTIVGTLANYPGGGYVTNFDKSIRVNAHIYQVLRKELWMDDRTRCIIIELLSFNANYNCFSYVRLLLELSATGYVHPTVFIYPARILVDPQNPTNIGTFIIFAFFLLWLGYMILRKLIVMCKKGKACWTDFWLYIDLIIPLLGLVSILIILLRVANVQTVVDNIESKNYHNHYHLFQLEDVWIGVSASLLILATLRLWTLLRFAIIFRLVELTTIFAALPIIHVIMCYIILLTAFGTSGFMLFGDSVKGFQSFYDTFNTLLAMSFKFYTIDVSEYSTYSWATTYFWIFSLCMIIVRYYFAAIVLVSYTKARVEFSSKDDTYSIKKFVMEKKDYIPKALMFKFRRMRGGELEDDSYLKQKIAGFKRNTISINTSDIEIMSTIIKCHIRNKQRAKTGRQNLEEHDFQLMMKITRLMFQKKVSNVGGGKESFFKETVKNEKTKLVDSKRMQEAERVVRVVLNPKIAPPKGRPDKNLEKCSLVIKQGLNTLLNSTTTLKRIQNNLNKIDI